MRLTALFGLAFLILPLASSPGVAAMLPAVADAEVGERPNDDRGSNGTSMNTRFTNTDRNEIMVMRFDLTGVDFGSIGQASLQLVHHRDNNSQRPYIVYGVNDGAMGGDNNSMTPGYDDNTWDEAAVRMSTMPGLVYDGDSTTQGINATDTTVLGSGAFSNALKGDVESIELAGLLSFLSSHPDDLVTLIVARDPTNTGTGQDRFATRETTALDGGSPSGIAGDFAPTLLLQVPEPASVLLLGLAGLLFAAVPRPSR